MTDRQKARAKILTAANRHQIAVCGTARAPYRMRHIQQAVCVVRRSRLVPAGVLADAGFNA